MDIQKTRAKKAMSEKFPKVAKRFLKTGLPKKVTIDLLVSGLVVQSITKNIWYQVFQL